MQVQETEECVAKPKKPRVTTLPTYRGWELKATEVEGKIRFSAKRGSVTVRGVRTIEELTQVIDDVEGAPATPKGE